MKHEVRLVTVGLVTALLAAALLTGCGAAPGPGSNGGNTLQAPAAPVPLSSGHSRAIFELENASEETVSWTLEVSDSPDNPQGGAWFSADPLSGRLEPFERNLVMLVQKPDLAPGEYRSTLSVRYPGGETLLEVAGQVTGEESWASGSGSISGRLSTANALIPIRTPTSFSRSSLSEPATEPGAEAAAEPGAQAAHGPRAEPAGRFLPGEFVIALDPAAYQLADGEDLAEVVAERNGAQVIERDPDLGTALVAIEGATDAQAAARALAEDPAVDYAEPNYLFYPHAFPGDNTVPGDPYLQDAWQLPVIGAPVAWQALPEFETPVVAVIDSGIDLDHEDLRGVFVSGGYDFCASSDCRQRDTDPRPESSVDTHGTHVTGLLAAVAGNGRGSGGVVATGARVLPIKVFSGGGYTTASALADAIRWAAGETIGGVPNPNPARIITLSLGATADSRVVREAIDRARSRGALVVASSGNQGERGVDYPARYSEVIGVGSVNTGFQRSCFSDYGEGLDLMAPGGDGYRCQAGADEALLSTFPNNDYGVDAGTSMAAPLVAGVAALVWGDMEMASAERVRARLLESAFFDGAFMDDEHYGAGVVRADSALGFPGPGDDAVVQATGPSTAIDDVTLDRYGSSARYSLPQLAAGSYSVEADAAGRSRSLSGSVSIELGQGEALSNLIIPLER